MVQVRIDFITGATFPVDVYISDVYGNYQTLIGTITSAVPPEVDFNTSIPAIFQTAPQIMLTLVDSNGCSIFKILDCVFGCAFNITVDLVDCIVNISIQDVSCDFNIYTSDETCAMMVQI